MSRRSLVFAAALLAAGCDSRSAEVPPETRAWLERHAPSEPWLAAPSPRFSWNPARRQAEELILGPGNEEFSLLWLQALGVSHLVSRDSRKFDQLLGVEHEAASGHRVYRMPMRRAAPAVIVSRRQASLVPRVRSVLDREALEAYVEWTNRPEAAGFRWTSDTAADVRADLGPDDVILVRHDFGPGWTATIEGRAVECRADPIGLVLVDPGREGRVVIQLTRAQRAALPWRLPPSLPEHRIPVIAAGGVLDGLRHTPPPFAPGTAITIYGANLRGRSRTRVLLGGRELEVLFEGDSQINVQLPAQLAAGPAELVVAVGEARSTPVTIGIAPP